MIDGSVNANDEAVVPLVVLDPDGGNHPIKAVIDTGFSGFLTLPLALIETLGLEWLASTTAVLGDGSSHTLDIYTATVLWDDRASTVDIAAANVDPLVGMAILRGYVVEIHVIEDGPVRISPLADPH